MIGAPTNFRHTGHIGSSDVEMGLSRLHAIQGQMQSKGGYEATIEVIICLPFCIIFDLIFRFCNKLYLDIWWLQWLLPYGFSIVLYFLRMGSFVHSFQMEWTMNLNPMRFNIKTDINTVNSSNLQRTKSI